MNSEEIKAIYGMRDILQRYGIETNRAGFIPCPFHKGDREASMKIYPDSYHCFGCGANGDIFTFIQKMDNITFKEAFLSLGGTYEKPSFHSSLAVYHSKKAQEMRKKEEEKLRWRKAMNNDLIDIYRDWMDRSEPLSDTWCDCCNALQYQLYIHDELGKEVVS